MMATGECVCDAGYRAGGVVGVFPWAALSCLPATSAAAVLNAYPESAAIAVSYYSVQLASAKSSSSSLLGKISKAFQHLYAPAAVGCLNRKPGTRDDACQALANLCVLQLYNPAATVCALYTAFYNARKAAVNGFQGWPGGGLPFLTYSATEARAVATDPALTRPMSFDEAKEAGTSDTVQFFLARYSLNGTFLGIARLRNQLDGFCAAAAASAVPTASSGTAEWSSSSVTTPWLGFGYGYSSVFACDLNLLAASPLATDPVFFDLYVRDLAADAAQLAAAARAAASGSSASSSASSGGAAAGLPLTLYPVPVAITNYVAADGSTPNVNKASASEADDVYVRRFTLVEAVSGITAAGAASEVLRYASSLRLTVRALRDGNNRPTLLSPPVLTITYRERLMAEVAAAAADASPSSMAVDATVFAVEYTSENADYGRTVLALAVSLGMLVLGRAFVRVTGWIRMNARTPFEAAISLVHVAKLGEYLLTTFAPAFFWFLWAMCLYWLVFFKLQTAVYILLPVDRPGYVDNEYVPFTAALTTVFICYLLRVLLAIYYQVRVDLFFVDWEKPRGALVRTGGDHEAALGKQVAPGMPGATASTDTRFAPISVWRTLHAANEWAELQTARRLCLPFVLAVIVALMVAGRLQFVAVGRPGTSDLSAGAINPLLQFANNVFWWLVVAAVQLAWTVLVRERYVDENPSAAFIDVCTVAKVSLLIMDQRYHGFYLHANAPHEHADGSMAELGEHLFEEAAAMRVGRGLPGCPDPACQTFELHVPALWRDMYDRVYRRLVDSETAAVNAMFAGPAGQGVAQLQALQQQQRALSAAGGHPLSPAGAAAPGTPSASTSLTAVSSFARVRERTRRLGAGFSALSAFVRGFIEETDPDYRRVWRERTLVQQLFDLPPDMLTEGLAAAGGGVSALSPTQGGSAAGRLTYMLRDPGYRFERVIFRGMELDLLVWDMLVYCFTDYWQQSPAIAAVVTYVVATALAWARMRLGQRNIAYKTLIDERFLK